MLKRKLRAMYRLGSLCKSKDGQGIQWIADKCGVSYRTVCQWASKDKLPEYAISIILMHSKLINIAENMFISCNLVDIGGKHGREFYDSYDKNIERVVTAIEMGDCCVGDFIAKTIDGARKIAIRRLIEADFLEQQLQKLGTGEEGNALNALKEIGGSMGNRFVD